MPARRHAGYRHALKLLNDTFRKSSLAQRLAVLQAAAWLIDCFGKDHDGSDLKPATCPPFQVQLLHYSPNVYAIFSYFRLTT